MSSSTFLSTLSSSLDAVKYWQIPNVVAGAILPRVYQIIEQVGGRRNMTLLTALSLVSLLSFQVYYKVFRVPSNFRHLPRVSAWQTINIALHSTGMLNYITRENEYMRKDALRRGIIKSMDETPPLWVTWFTGTYSLCIGNPTDCKDFFVLSEKFEKYKLDNGSIPLFQRFTGLNVESVRTQEWKRQRKVINPAFRRGWDTSIFGPPTRILIQHLDDLASSNTTVDINNWMGRITLDALSIAVFGTNFNALNDPNSPMVAVYKRCMSQLPNPFLFILGRYAKILPIYHQCCKDIDQFNKFILDLIEEKMRTIDNLTSIVDDEDQNCKKNLLELMIMAQRNSDRSFTREDLRANCVAFFVAGHDTTANSLTFALYLLGMNPRIQDKVRKEVIQILGDVENGTSASDFPYPKNEELNQMKYLMCVIKETMRLYPPAAIIPLRETMSDHIFASTGQKIGKSEYVSLHIWNLHHAKEYWGEDSHEFKPERWDALNVETDGSISVIPSTHNYMWVPFGGGQRLCIGQQFSMIEQRVILPMLLLRYTWKVVGDEDVLKGQPKTGQSILLNPYGITLELKKRN